ncbi:MAG: hypothetical protein WBG01_13615 [Bacteroidota bacterium]
MSATAGATVAAAAAAEQRRRLHEEEERMTPYRPEEIEEWEFKIVRAMSARFKTRQALQQLLKEEAESGWEMLEKLDDSRVRFKRKKEHRAADGQRSIDPYRTHVGLTEGGVVVTVLVALALVAGLAVLVVNLVK